MKHGRPSQTAIKVAMMSVALAQRSPWRERLPAGLAAITVGFLDFVELPLVGKGRGEIARRPWVRRGYELADRLRPGTFEGIGHRKLFMNTQTVAAIEAGATQVLVLGAGFDTLATRLAPRYPNVVFVEIDHPSTAVAKRLGVESQGQPPNMHLVSADLAKTSLHDALASCGAWSEAASSVVVAEGLLMYLSHQTIDAMLRQLHACTGPGSRFVCSHLLDLGWAGAVSRWALARSGEGWKSAISRALLPGYVESRGWRVIEQDAPRTAADLEGFAVAERI